MSEENTDLLDQERDPHQTSFLVGMVLLIAAFLHLLRPLVPGAELVVTATLLLFLVIFGLRSPGVVRPGWWFLMVVLGALVARSIGAWRTGGMVAERGLTFFMSLCGLALLLGYVRWLSDWLTSPEVIDQTFRKHQATGALTGLMAQQSQDFSKLRSINETLLDSVPMGFMLTEPSGKIVHANPALLRITGKLMIDLMGKATTDVFGGTPLGEAMEKLARRSVGQPSTLDLIQSPIPKGPEAIRLTAAYSQGGSLVYVLEDISQRVKNQQAERKILGLQLESEKLRSFSGLITGVTREMNDALGVLLGYTELLSSRPNDTEMRDRAVPTMLRAVHRCRKIVGNLWEFSSEKVTLKQRVHLPEILEEALELLHHRFADAGITIEKQLSRIAPTMADRQQILQAFFHLLHVSYKTLVDLPKDRRLIINCKQERDHVRFFFETSGSCFPAAFLDSDKEVFGAADGGTFELAAALTSARGLLQAHDGQVKIEQPASGVVRLVAEIPLSEEQARLVSIPGNERVRLFPGKRLLLVDDEQGFLELYSSHLTDHGMKVETCTNGEQVLLKLKEQQYDLISLDLAMPGMNGRELHRRIMESHPQLSRQIVFLTAVTTDPEVREFLSSTGASTLFKPFTLAQLDRFLALAFARIASGAPAISADAAGG